MNYAGVAGFVILTSSIWAFVATLDAQVSTATKIIWGLVLFLLPGLGLVIWLFLRPPDATLLAHDN